jgi:hypothetical protein
MMHAQNLISDIRSKLAELEKSLNGDVPSIYGLPENGLQLELELEPGGKEPKFLELGEDEIDLIDQDDSRIDMVSLILECTAKANRLVGISPATVSEALSVPRYRVEKIMRDLFFNGEIEKVNLRPIAYRIPQKA